MSKPRPAIEFGTRFPLTTEDVQTVRDGPVSKLIETAVKDRDLSAYASHQVLKMIELQRKLEAWVEEQLGNGECS